MSELLHLAEKVVGWAREGEQVEAVVVRSSNTSIKVHKGEIESFASAQSEGIGVRVIAGGRQGIAYATVLDPAVLEEVLVEARDNAAFGAVDPNYGLAEPDGVAPTQIDIWRDELLKVPADQKIDIALDAERRVFAADSRIRAVRSTMWADSASETALASSNGMTTSDRSTTCYLLVGSAIAGEGDDTQTGSGFTVGRKLDDLDLDRPVTDAVHNATRLLGAVKPASAKLTVVLEPEVTQSLLGIIAASLNGESVLKGRSLFANRVGEEVAPEFLDFIEDPTDPEAFAARTYDGEGLATRRTPLIEGGVLQGFLYNTYAARRAGTASTASASRGLAASPGISARAVRVEPGSKSQPEIIAGISHGVLIDSFKGLHSGVNIVSGDFSVGATGLMIRNGEIAEPVREITIASSIQRLLLDVVEVGNDLEWTSGSAAGVTLAIEGVSMGGT
ncbi:MAG TPA: TldD/PmbA family protein [Acidimicrobiales bacterium]|nr:TldD/PmbA family protein [Acidimicrobiales bacterium]